jgi:hypothetical protein
MNLRALGTWVVLLSCALSTFSGPLELIEQQIEIPERGPVTGYLLSLGTNHFSFLPPPRWRASHRPGANSVAIMSSDSTTSITIDFIAVKADGEGHNPLSLIKERFADTTPGESIDCHTGLGLAIGYDLQRKGASGLRLTSRVIYVLTPAAVIEFTLTAPAATFLVHATAFAGLVNSFRVAGK